MHITIDLARDRYALENLMEFDHVIRVHEDGTVSEPRGIWAPEVVDNSPEGGPEDLHVSSMGDGARWTLLRGWTGQYNYRGPVMHDSEFVGGALARHILDNPGFYVVVMVTDANGADVGWAIAHWGPDVSA